MNNNTDNTAYASERCEFMFSMLSRSEFAPCAIISPTDDVIIHPSPDFIIDFVPSVKMLIGVPSWMIITRLSGYLVKICFNSCYFHIWSWL